MKVITDVDLINAINTAVGKEAEYIQESCRLYHFHFKGNTSFSYDKSSIIKLLCKNSK
jgi:hypothetical protein